MGSVSASHNLAIMIFFLFCCVLCSSAGDSFTQGGWLGDDGSTLVSPDGTFELGFFTPHGGPFSGRYVGIWYSHMKEKAVVWVANRDQPLNGNKTARFGIAEDGRLKAWDNRRGVYLFTGVDDSSSTSRVVKLMDSGNLVLSDSRSRHILWKSFHNPTDTFLPGMKMDETLTLNSWLSSVDPASGTYTFKLDSENQYNIIWGNSIVTYWSSKYSEGTHDEMTDAIPILLSNFSKNFYNRSVKTLSYKYEGLVMSSSGEIQYHQNRSMPPVWWAPQD